LREAGSLFAGWDAGLRCQERPGDYVRKFFAFLEQRADPFSGDQLRDDHEAQPTSSFAEFLEGYGKFMDEIGAAFSGTAFVVIRRTASTTSNPLTGNVPAQPGFGKGIHGLADSGGKPPQAVGQLIGCHT
jgi:hypothetical protein